VKNKRSNTTQGMNREREEFTATAPLSESLNEFPGQP
jgi:hypothetical protein